MKTGQFYGPAELLALGYVGERCLLCGDILHSDQRTEHLRLHAAAGHVAAVAGTTEDPDWHAIAFVRSTRLPSIHGRQYGDQVRTQSTVHVLHHGQPLCGFSDQPFPCQWPERNWWVGLDERDHANCPECITVVTGMMLEVVKP